MHEWFLGQSEVCLHFFILIHRFLWHWNPSWQLESWPLQPIAILKRNSISNWNKQKIWGIFYFATDSFDASETFSILASTFPMISTRWRLHAFPLDTCKIGANFHAIFVTFTLGFDTSSLVTCVTFGAMSICIAANSDVVTLFFLAYSTIILLYRAISWPLAGVGTFPLLAKLLSRTVRMLATFWYTSPILATMTKYIYRVFQQVLYNKKSRSHKIFEKFVKVCLQYRSHFNLTNFYNNNNFVVSRFSKLVGIPCIIVYGHVLKFL